MKHNRKTQEAGIAAMKAENGSVLNDWNKQHPVETIPAEAVVVKSKKSPRLTEEALAARYPSVRLGSLRFETEGRYKGKQTVEALLDCGHDQRIATSDLFQKKQCDACKHPVKAPQPKAEKKSKPAATPVVPIVATSDHQRLDAETRSLALQSA
jgi:hypothetical protein